MKKIMNTLYIMHSNILNLIFSVLKEYSSYLYKSRINILKLLKNAEDTLKIYQLHSSRIYSVALLKEVIFRTE